MKKRFFTLLGGVIYGALLSLTAQAQVWTDVTEKIVNPSFESDEASSNLKDSGQSGATGWTVTQSSLSNSQWGVASSECTIQGIASTLQTEDGGNYYYIRTNWNNDPNLGISQVIADLPAGMYKLTFLAATHSGNWSTVQHTVSLIEGDGQTSVKTLYSTGAAWTPFEVYINKESSTSTLTIKANMKAGSSGSGQHYQLLLDNLKLYYCEDLGASADNPVDLTGYISNPNIMNTNNAYVPRGWTSSSRSVGNGNYTEGTGNTQLEAWSGGNMYFDYNQTLAGLPNGMYKLTAYCHDSNQKGGHLYASSGDLIKKVNMTTDYSSITTGTINVTDGTLKIGIKSETTSGGSWMTGDSFTLSFIGFDASELLADLAEQIAEATFTEKHSASTETALSTAIAAAQALINAATGTKEEIETASSNLATAIADVQASIADYANLAAAIDAAATYTVITPSYTTLATAIETAEGVYNAATAESCTDAIAALNTAANAAKVADYAYVTTDFQYGVELGDWIPNGPTGELTGQHWSGNNSRKYLEQSGAAWSQDAWSISYSQDVTLPAGDYVFKVAGRKASGNNCTLQLVVTDKTTSALIGTVSDFPEGDTGLGINKTGVTSFDPSDPEGFANDGMGRGFQWRYVKFSLTESTTVNIAVSAEAWKREQWVSFCDATVQTNNEANIAMITYNVALNDANTALANATYANVTGSERTDLADAVAADMTGKTKAEVEAATTALKELTTAFKEAAAAYDKYAAVLNSTVADLPYAAVAKKEAVATALAATPTTAAECLAAIEVINRALLEYYESNGRADGADGAKNVTDWIQNPLFTDGLNGWTSSQTGGNLGAPNNEPPTFSDGSNAAYYDYYNGDANNQHGYQTIKNMPAGVYYLTITVRADGNLNNVFVKIGDQKVTVNKIGATGGVYGRGWNDYSVEYTNAKMQDVTIEVYSTPDGGNKSGWFGFTNVRLIQLQAGAQLSINPTAQYGTFIAPFSVTIPEGVEAFTCLSTDGSTLVLDGLKETIPANTPVIVFSESEEGIDQTFYGKSTATEDTYTNGLLTGVYTATAAPVGSYVLMLSDDKAVFGTVVADHQPTVGANRCYFTAPADNEAKAFFFGRGTTNIDNLGINAPADDVIYDLTGRRVEKATKGIYIINGKKTYIK